MSGFTGDQFGPRHRGQGSGLPGGLWEAMDQLRETFEQKFSALFSGKVTSSTLGLISTIGLGLGFIIAVSSFLAAVQDARR